MPTVNHTVSVQRPLSHTWDFVKETGNWATLLPGYQSYEKIDDRTFRWKMKADIGMFSRVITLRVDIVEWDEGRHVRFLLQGEDEGVKGEGSLDIAASGENETALRVELGLESTGTFASIVNAFLDKVLAGWVQQFAEGLKAKVESA